jgi:hypothetical protein
MRHIPTLPPAFGGTSIEWPLLQYHGSLREVAALASSQEVSCVIASPLFARGLQWSMTRKIILQQLDRRMHTRRNAAHPAGKFLRLLVLPASSAPMNRAIAGRLSASGAA